MNDEESSERGRSMRSYLGKIVRTYFDKRMEELLPEFSLFNDPTIPQHYRLYIYDKDPLFAGFILLQPAERREEFTLEVAWSKDRVYPAYHFDMRLPIINNNTDKVRFRMRLLWDQSKKGDTDWWKFDHLPVDFNQNKPDEYMVELLQAETKRLVNDAIERIVKYALPYFEQVRSIIQN